MLNLEPKYYEFFVNISASCIVDECPMKHYAYVLWCKNPTKEYVWSKIAEYVDEALAKLLLAKLSAKFNSAAWEEALPRSDAPAVGRPHRDDDTISVCDTV